MASAFKATIISVVHLIAATAVYWHLITGGWLTTNYQLNDPNIVNLLLAIFEPMAVLLVIAYWLRRTPFLDRLIFILFCVQLFVGASFLVFFLVFALTWHAKMM
jgi:hypothetical protein